MKCPGCGNPSRVTSEWCSPECWQAHHNGTGGRIFARFGDPVYGGVQLKPQLKLTCELPNCSTPRFGISKFCWSHTYEKMFAVGVGEADPQQLKLEAAVAGSMTPKCWCGNPFVGGTCSEHPTMPIALRGLSGIVDDGGLFSKIARSSKYAGPEAITYKTSPHIPPGIVILENQDGSIQIKDVNMPKKISGRWAAEEMLMLNALKNIAARIEGVDIDELVALLAFGRSMKPIFEEMTGEEPEWLTEALGRIEKEIKTRYEDTLNMQLKEARAKRDALKTAEEKRSELSDKIKRLEAKLGKTPPSTSTEPSK